MHTAKFIIAGLLIWTVINILSHLWLDKIATGSGLAIFLALWLIISVVHLWIGVFHAGYSFAEELPILMVVFSVPAVLALFSWLLTR